VRGAGASRAEHPSELALAGGGRRGPDDLVDAAVGKRQHLGAAEQVEDVRRSGLRAQLLERVHRLVDDEDVAVRRDALGERGRVLGADRENGGQCRKNVKSR
jgi:hypothetical protein